MPRDELYLIEIIEAIDRYPDVPWRRIADFRNVAVHEYFDSTLSPRVSSIAAIMRATWSSVVSCN
jgi:uncharacterized protein with HEPN domain